MGDRTADTKEARCLRQRAEAMGLRFVSLVDKQAKPETFSSFSIEDALRLNVAPFLNEEGELAVAFSEPENSFLENQICRLAGGDIDLYIAEASDIASYLRHADGSGQVLRNVARDFQPKLLRDGGGQQDEVVDLDAVVGEAGVVKLFNSILLAGLEKGVSDIHFEHSGREILVKYRIDGILQPATDQIDAAHHEELVSRIKVLAELDIAEQRVPQDGRFRIGFEGREVDFRVSVLPTQFGEDVVIRILDKASLAEDGEGLTLAKLGLTAEDLSELRRQVLEPHGLMLLTGPTGSGKTTTLYAAISEANDGTQKIITIEDPIEYDITSVVQIPVNEKKGLTFASGLRSILRHDPDKVMVGEIRDRETAEIAIQAALTGHLVLATVHANNTQDVIGRFTHWGIDLHDFVAALNSVFAQRLFRKLCLHCRQPDGQGGYEPTGCLACGQTGYKGRAAALEHLIIDEEIAELIVARAVFGALTGARQRKGMRELRVAAKELVASGITSAAEVSRVLGQSDNA